MKNLQNLATRINRQLHTVGSWEIGNYAPMYTNVGMNPDVAGEQREELGARALTRHVHGPAQAHAPAQAWHPQQGAPRPYPGLPVTEMGPTKDREWILGFDSVGTVAAAGTFNATNQPQAVFRPERVIIGAGFAAFFIVNDIRVGQWSQFLAPGAVPGESFSSTAFGVRLRMDTAQISQIVSINITNIDVAAHRFVASMIGIAVQ